MKSKRLCFQHWPNYNKMYSGSTLCKFEADISPADKWYTINHDNTHLDSQVIHMKGLEDPQRKSENNPFCNVLQQ